MFLYSSISLLFSSLSPPFGLTLNEDNGVPSAGWVVAHGVVDDICEGELRSSISCLSGYSNLLSSSALSSSVDLVDGSELSTRSG